MEKRDIVIVCTDEGNIVFYDTTLSDEELTKWTSLKKLHLNDVITERQDNLQYYCIDVRRWMNPEKDEIIRMAINN